MAISAMLKSKLDQLRAVLDGYPALHTIENTLHIPKEWLVLGLAAAVAACLASGYGAALISNLAGFLFPARGSFKALEGGGKREANQWLTYWLLYSALSIPETFSSLVTWIPFYYIFKVFFLVWCWLPQTQGALFIYEHVLKGVLSKSEPRIDAMMNKVHGATNGAAQHASASLNNEPRYTAATATDAFDSFRTAAADAAAAAGKRD